MNLIKNQTIKSILCGLILISIATYISHFIFNSFNALSIWIGAVWLIVVMCFFLMSTNGSLFRFIWYNGAILIFVLTLLESYLWLTEENFIKSIKDLNPTTTVDDFLGYAPIKNIKYTETQYYRDKLVHSSSYTIDENGSRITPSPNGTSVKGHLLFFGCSITYGAGVNDFETMPYQVGSLSNGRYRIHNFAFMGYGPHQMLSAIENGLVENIVGHDDKPKIAIYQAIPDHIRRSAGCFLWDCHAPHYKLDPNGEVFYVGHFDDYHIIPQRVKQKLINKFQIYKKIVQSEKPFRDGDIESFLGIVNASKTKFEAQYPQSTFYIIWWDWWNLKINKNKRYNEKILEALKNMKIQVYLISDILPDFNNYRLTYQVSPYDSHPNSLAHQIIAKYIIDNILDEHVSSK